MKLTRLASRPLSSVISYPLLIIMFIAPVANCVATVFDITKEEMALTAPFCADTEAFGGKHQCTGGRTPKSYYWQNVLGNGFCHLHHYCWAEITVVRAERHDISARVREHLYGVAIDDYKYVVRNSPADFVLLPEIYTRIGALELRINHPDKANEAFARARELKPDYWPAYSRWVEFLIKAGRPTDARALAKRGLENSPSAKVLIEQYQRLGGNLNDIEARPNAEDSGEARSSKN